MSHSLTHVLSVTFYMKTHWTGGWVDPRSGLVAKARGKSPARDRTPIIQPEVSNYTEKPAIMGRHNKNNKSGDRLKKIREIYEFVCDKVELYAVHTIVNRKN